MTGQNVYSSLKGFSGIELPSEWPLGKLKFPALESLLLSPIRAGRVALLAVFTLSLAAVATFRNFGFDMDTAKQLYPYVADGWGLWYWLAQTGIGSILFFFIVNLALSALILLLAFPSGQRALPLSVSLVALLYLDCWFLFGQARYGMAVALISIAAAAGGVPTLIIFGLLAFFIHKVTVGGLLLVALWYALKKMRHGLAIAAVLCAVLTYIVEVAFSNVLLVLGYGNYLVWTALPSANTPYKFYYIVAILLLWKCLDRNAPNSVLILTLLFLPFSYFNVFAGRAFEFYAIMLLPCLGDSSMPRYVRYPILTLFLADVSWLFFTSGFYL
jgi:hypothetical protein